MSDEFARSLKVIQAVYDERDDLRKKLTKTAIKYATMWKNDGHPTPVETMIAVIYADCGVRLRWNEDEYAFEEDDR